MAGEMERLLIRVEADTAQLRRALEQADRIVGQKVASMERSLANANTRLTQGMAAFGKVALANNVANQRMVAGMSQTPVVIDRIGASAKRTSSGLGLMGRAFVGAFAVHKVAEYTGALARQADTYTLMSNRLSVVVRSAHEFDYVQQRLMQVAQDSRVPIQDINELYARMGFALKDTTATTNELITFTELLAKATIVSGATTSEAEGALRQLSQGMGATQLRGQELISVMEQMPYVADMIARHMGVAVGDLKKLGEQGKLTRDVIFQAMFAGQAELEAKFKKTASTMAQGMAQLNNVLLEFVGLADRSSGASAKITAGIRGMAEAIGEANKKWREGATWWEWFKAWKGKDFSEAWDAAAGVQRAPIPAGPGMIAAGQGFQGNIPNKPPPTNSPDPWAASIIPPTYDEQLREMKETWDEIRESQMLTLEDLVGDQMQTAEEKMRALNEAVRQGSIGWRDYGDMKETVDRQVERSQRALLSTTGQFLDSMFEGSKTAAIASALINTFEGISKALTLLPPYSYAAASMTAAMGFAQVRAIQSTNKASKGGATATPSAASAQGAAGAQEGGGVSRSLFVQGISPDQLYSGNQVAGIAEALLEFQRNGGQVVLDRRA